MKEIKGDILELMTTGEFQAFCITTNGFVKKNGACVMGRGIALTCRDLFPNLDMKLGRLIRNKGNHVWVLDKYQHGFIISFPVKHNWWEDADIELIKRSCHELMQRIDNATLTKKVLLPRPGCGNGKLKWEDVKPVIEQILDDRVYVATF